MTKRALIAVFSAIVLLLTACADVGPDISAVAETYTVFLRVNNAEYGSVDAESVGNVAKGAALTMEGNCLTVNDVSVTATPAVLTGYTVTFEGWYVGAERVTDMTVTTDLIVTATFKAEKDGVFCYKAEYDDATGKVRMERAEGDDYAFADFGVYEKGGFVKVEFRGQALPQIAFFLSEGTTTPLQQPLGCILFSSDGNMPNDFRLFDTTSTEGRAVLFNRWSGAAHNFLEEDTEYVFYAGCVRNGDFYDITLMLYSKTAEGILQAEDDLFTITLTDIDVSGSRIVLFGSRYAAIEATVAVSENDPL